MAAPPDFAAALRRIGESEWAKQETCYLTMLKLLDNILAHPGEEKFRRLKTSNAALRAKVFDVPGAHDALLAAGFVPEGGEFLVAPAGLQTAALSAAREEGGEFLVAPAGLQTAALSATREALQHHANDAKMHELRVERDARIAAAKAEEHKLDYLKAKAHLTPEEKEELKRNIERDRAEFEAERALNPVHESHATDLKFGATQGDTSYLKKQGGG